MFIVSQTTLPYSEFEGNRVTEKGGVMTMMNVQDKKQQASQLIALFAELYKSPTFELWNELKIGRLLESLQHEAESLFNESSQIGTVEIPETYEQLKSLYLSSLSSIKKGTALPIESLYKQWTSDKTCQMPFANSKGYLLGDPALHIRFILNELQMEIPEEFSQIPDHLTILLELLAYFLEHSPAEFVHEFLGDHFDWVDEFAAKLDSVSEHSFYPQITRLLIRQLNALKSWYNEDGNL